MTAPARAFSPIPLANRLNSAGSYTNLAIQVVVVHGSVSPDGHLGELEILASTDATLNQNALDRAKALNDQPILSRTQPGATPQSHEVLYTFEFVTAVQ